MSNIAVLVLGGCGFVGRNLVELLVKEPDVAFIRVVDKVPPQMAWLSRKHASVFESEKVQFSSCNLLSKLSREKVFLREGMRSFDFVINLAAETKPGQDEAVYREGIVSLSVACAEEALKTGVKRYVELSSGNMGSSEKHPMKENANPEPWTVMAKHKRIVEQKLSKMIHDLDIIFIRPPLVYGRADRNSLMPWIAIAAVYKHLSETMEILWTEKLRRDVCHVTDLSRAIWHLTLNGKRGEVYNITDMSETTLGEIIDVICGMINVKYSFLGNFWSSLAKLDLEGVVEEGNEKHLNEWSRLCKENGLENTPVSPFISKETILGKHLWLDTTKLKATGFCPLYPKIEACHLKEVNFQLVKLLIARNHILKRGLLPFSC